MSDKVQRRDAIGGTPSQEDIVQIGAGCSMSCTFCPHGGGRSGRSTAEILDPSYPLPVASRVTLLAGDLIRADLAPVVERLRSAGSRDVFIYATPGAWDLDSLDALKRAGLTGLHLMLPSASRDALKALAGPRASLGLMARLVRHAAGLGLRFAADIPVVQSTAASIHETVDRFLRLPVAHDRVILRFLAEFDSVKGPIAWDHSLAAKSVSDAAISCRTARVDLVLAHPEAPPACRMNLTDASIDMYPGLRMSGARSGDTHPYQACKVCFASSICPAGRLSPDVEPTPLPAPGATTNDTTPTVKAARPTSIVIWQRQAVLEGLSRELAAKRLACRYPWEQMEAHDIRGTVTPCAGGWPLNATINDCWSWHDSSLLGAWNSPAMQRVRASIAANDPMATCKPECPAFHGGPQSALPSFLAPSTQVMFDNIVANTREMLDGATILNSRPQSISFSPTMRCTNRCRMCDIHEVMQAMGRPAIVREMPDALFDELIDLLPTTRMLALTGGEPLVSKRMRQVLARFRADDYPDGAVTITTNGQLLNQHILNDLSVTRIKLFYVSLNAADDEMYEFVSGVRGGFSRVRRNLETLISTTPRMAGRPGVVLSFVVMRSNFRQLPAFLDLARRLGTGVRLLPVERDRLGESIFTDEQTLAEVRGMLARSVIPVIAGFPWGYRAEVTRLDSILSARMSARDFRPL